MKSDRRTMRLGWLALIVTVTTIGCGRFEARRELKAGNADYRKEKFADALTHYANVPKGSLDHVRATLNSGYAHMAQYRFGSKHPKDLNHAATAIEFFDAYLLSRPANKEPGDDFPGVEAIEEKVITLLVDTEKFESAVDRLNQSLERNPGDIAVVTGLAAAYDKWEKPEAAVGYYQKLAELEPDKPTRDVYISQYSWDMSYRKHMTMTPLERNRWIDVGLAAASTALIKDPDHFEGNVYKNLLLRERAKMRIDPDEIASLYVEASALQRKAKAIRAIQKAEEEAKKAAEEAAEAATASGEGSPDAS